MYFLFILETELANYYNPVLYSQNSYSASDLAKMRGRKSSPDTFSDKEDVEFLVDGLNHLKLRAIKASSIEDAKLKYN